MTQGDCRQGQGRAGARGEGVPRHRLQYPVPPPEPPDALRAPRVAHPRRVGNSYLLSGLVRCKTCNRALSGQDAKSGQFAYYVCQSIMKRGKDACKTPRLNARRFEELVVGKIRSNVLTDSNIRALVKVVDEQMDDVAQEQRKRLETIEDELEDVKRKLGRIWHFVETADNVEMTDASERIREHRDRQERLEDLAAEARAILAQRREVLDERPPSPWLWPARPVALASQQSSAWPSAPGCRLSPQGSRQGPCGPDLGSASSGTRPPSPHPIRHPVGTR